MEVKKFVVSHFKLFPFYSPFSHLLYAILNSSYFELFFASLESSFPPRKKKKQGRLIAGYLSLKVAVGDMFICSKIGAKSFKDGSQEICKYKEIWDQLLAFRALIIKKNAFLNLHMMPCTP